jgi:hypothetical protein
LYTKNLNNFAPSQQSDEPEELEEEEQEEEEEGENEAYKGSKDSDDDEMTMFLNSTIFRRDFQWSSHPFDANPDSYRLSCPVGGPGGLICCDFCSTAYSNFLTETHNDLESQKISLVATETSELTRLFLNDASSLEKTYRTTKRRPPVKKKVQTKT